MSRMNALVAGLALASLAACGGGGGEGLSVIGPTTRTPISGMPTSGSAVFRGDAGLLLGGTDFTPGTVTVRTNFAPGGGAVTGIELDATGATGSFATTASTPFTGNTFSGIPVVGTIERTGDQPFTATSGGANTVVFGGQFLGESAARLRLNSSGSISFTDSSGTTTTPQVTGTGVIARQP